MMHKRGTLFPYLQILPWYSTKVVDGFIPYNTNLRFYGCVNIARYLPHGMLVVLECTNGVR